MHELPDCYLLRQQEMPCLFGLINDPAESDMRCAGVNRRLGEYGRSFFIAIEGVFEC